MNKLLFFIATLGMSVAISSCKKEKTNCVSKTISQENLQGKWKHDYRIDEPDFSHPDEYNSIISYNDSFQFTVTHRSDMLMPDGCDETLWTEYAKGKIAIQSNGDVYFEGLYCESDFSIKTSGCKI